MILLLTLILFMSGVEYIIFHISAKYKKNMKHKKNVKKNIYINIKCKKTVAFNCS